MHHSSTSTYVPNFTEIEETSCGQTDGHLRLAWGSTLKSHVTLATPLFGVVCHP